MVKKLDAIKIYEIADSGNTATSISLKWSRRELSIDMVVHRGIFENNTITRFPFLPSNVKQGLVFTVFK